MEEVIDPISPMKTFTIFFILSLFVITPIVILLFYFSETLSSIDPKIFTKGARMVIGFGIGLVFCVVLSTIATWRAMGKAPMEKEEEYEEEYEEEEEEEEDEEEDDED